MIKIKIIAFFVLFSTAFSTQANKGDWWLDIHLKSYHDNESRVWYDKYGQPQPWQENNWGVGLGYGITDHMELKVGWYRNSQDDPSMYGGVKWHTDYERFISVGITVGLVTNYDKMAGVDTFVMPYILPALTFHPHHRVRIDLGFVPDLANDSSYIEGIESEKTNVYTLTAGWRF